MRHAPNFHQLGAMVITLPLLASCANIADQDVETACPSAQIAVPSDQLGHRNDKGEVSFIARMDELASDCRENEATIEVDIAFTMKAERGPALEGDQLELVYYLATVDPDREIVDKQFLSIELAFEPDRQVSALREEVTVRLPIADEASGANYNLYLGFQPDRQP
jgi:hypothetical protein